VLLFSFVSGGHVHIVSGVHCYSQCCWRAGCLCLCVTREGGEGGREGGREGLREGGRESE